MKEINSFSITVTQDGETITISNASQGHTEVEEMMQNIEVTQLRYHDFFCDVSQYTFPLAGLKKPKRGAIITRSSDGARFAVTSPGDSKAPYDYTTPTEVRYRIHTVQVP
jgi:hypothetical protein